MKLNLAVAAIIAIGVILGGFLAGGRYEIVSVNGNLVARLDRFTGQVAMCIPGNTDDCEWELLLPPQPEQNSN